MSPAPGICRHLAPELAWLASRGGGAERTPLARCDRACAPGRCGAPDLFANGLGLVAPRSLLEGLARTGALILTPGWLREWRKETAAWGFDAEGLRDFAHESIASLCLLDTGVLPEAPALLAEMAERLGVPHTVIPVGMDYFREAAARLLPPEHEPEPGPGPGPEARRASDYAMALDLLAGLVGDEDEAAAVAGVLELAQALFAPAECRLVRFEEGGASLWSARGREDGDPEGLAGLAPRAAGSGVLERPPYCLLPLDRGGTRLGFAALRDLAFPDYKESYYALWEVIGPVCALALSDARAWAELRAERARLVASQEELRKLLAFRDRLISIVGHDLRGPIGGMRSALELMVDGSVGDPATERLWLAEILKSADAVSSLLENLLEWGRSQRGGSGDAPAPLSVKTVARNVLELLRLQAAAKRVGLREEVPAELLVTLPPLAFQTALRNLVSNAVKFTGESGQVLLRAEALRGELVLQVVDDGVGMDQATLDAVMGRGELRSRTGTAGERGTGLGLALVRDFAERSGGRFSVSSRPGAGTSVQLAFPVEGRP